MRQRKTSLDTVEAATPISLAILAKLSPVARPVCISSRETKSKRLYGGAEGVFLIWFLLVGISAPFLRPPTGGYKNSGKGAKCQLQILDPT
jgi:hypothetical protein